MLRNLFLSFCFLFVCGGIAQAQNCVDYDIYDAGRTYPGARFVVSFVADIQMHDLYSSAGVKLSTAQQVLRQDRANVHKFGKRDGSDTVDGFFSDAGNRAILETADYTTYCDTDLPDLMRSIVDGRVSGFVEVMVFRTLKLDSNIVFINIVG